MGRKKKDGQKELEAQKDREADRQKSLIRVVEVLARLHSLTTTPVVIGSQNEFLHRQMCISMCR